MNRTLRQTFWILLCLGCLHGPGESAYAQNIKPGLCPPPALPITPIPDTGAATRFDADRFSAEEEGIYVLRGDVVGVSQGRRIRAQTVRYNEKEATVTAQGKVQYQDQRLWFQADQGHFDLDADTGQLEALRYRMVAQPGRGEAERAKLTAADTTKLAQVTYTTCAPGDEDWLLQADQVTLHPEEGYGTARDVVLRFQGVPFAWLPWASFPLDDRRKSGLLAPTVGSGADGLDVSVPYYFNLAPNYDATVTPRLISERGLLLGGEFRYLAPPHAGELRFEYLPDDDIAGEERGLFEYRHRSVFTPNWRFDLDLNRATDGAYFEDFGNSLNVSAISYLQSQLAFTGAGPWWQASFSADDFQVLNDFINPVQEPYARLPRFWFEAARPLGDGPWYWSLYSEWVRFERDFGVTGTRLDLYPRLQARFARAGGYLMPTLGLRHTAYELDEAVAGSPSRSLPVASLEGGLVFERGLENGWLQTLEPRFYYLYVPFEAQGELPVFDTLALDFNFGELFRDNRFAGADRMGDANRLSLALTTRLLDPATGRSPLSASVGQIYHFDEREVQLPGAPVATRDHSPLIAEIEFSPLDAWSAALGLHLDLEDGESDKTVFGVRYRPDSGALVNVAYRFRRDRLKVGDVSMIWPVGDNWRLLGRWYYDIEGGRTLEALAGIEYESCCWALRLVGRHYVHNRQGETRDGIYLQLVLKGLGSLGGSRAVDVLEHGILGYSPQDY